MNKVILIILTSVCLSGCEDRRDADRFNIHSNYVAFREALLANDNPKARGLMGPEARIYWNADLRVIYSQILASNFVLNANSHVTFDYGRKDRAWLWPNSSPAPGTVGLGFSVGTNGWQINGAFMPVAH